MPIVTARVRCTRRVESGSHQVLRRHVQVRFEPDYSDLRNQEWSLITPSLSLDMTLNHSAADLFEPGKVYTLQFLSGGH